MLNTLDLVDAWHLDEGAVGSWRRSTHPVVRASAKTGEGVEEAVLAPASAATS